MKNESALEVLVTGSIIALSWAVGILTNSTFLLIFFPAIMGAFFSIYVRASRGTLKWRDIGFAFLSAGTWGIFLGRWIASLLPGNYVEPPMIFIFTLGGQQAVESLADSGWNTGEWVKKILKNIVPGGKDD